MDTCPKGGGSDHPSVAAGVGPGAFRTRTALIALIVSLGVHARAGAPGTKAVALPEPPTAVAVPFVFEKGQIVVEVALGAGGRFRFLLDTGTNPSIIDRGTAAALAIPLGEASNSGEGAGTGAMEIRHCMLPALSLGPLTAIGLEAAGVDLSSLSSGFGSRIDGVLGYGFLKDRIFTIDYARRSVIFYPARGSDRPDLFRRGRGRKVLPFDFYGDDRTPCARALSVGGSPALRVTLDTGSSGFAAVYYRTAAGLGWRERIESAPIWRSEGYRGSFPSAGVESGALAFAGFDLGPSEISVPLPGSNYGEEKAGIAEGNVGNALLSRFRITFDYPNRAVLVEKPDAGLEPGKP